MKLVSLSDIHSGDAYGLTDPANISPKKTKARKVAGPLFEWYIDKIAEIGKIDAMLLPGELLEGSGTKDTIELWSSDPEEQSDACADLLCMWQCKNYYACYSTNYHDGRDTNTDHMLVKEMKARGRVCDVKTTQRRDAEGLKINVLHHVGASSTPYTFASQLMKSGVTDVVRGHYRDYQSADLYLRGHTHMYGFVGHDKFTVINCPSMKWPLGRYGRRIDRPYYAMGLIEIDVQDRNHWEWTAHIFKHKMPEESYAKI